MKTIKLWQWVNDGPVKIKVKPNQTLTHYKWQRTDEGWSSELTTWQHAGNGVVRCRVTDGKDCDGRLTQSSSQKTTPSMFAKVPDHEGFKYEGRLIHYPRWAELTSSQRDEFAEHMNY
jgi:hypothetical protein